MRRIIAFCVPVAFATVFAGIVIAQTKPGAEPAPGVDPKPDARNGERLAQQWCATCHVVTPSQTQASAAVATFAEIAKRPTFDAASRMPKRRGRCVEVFGTNCRSNCSPRDL